MTDVDDHSVDVTKDDGGRQERPHVASQQTH